MEKIEIQFLKDLYNIILMALLAVLLISGSGYIIKFKKNKLPKYLLLVSLIVILSLFLGFRDDLVGTDTITYKYIYEYVFVTQSSFEVSRDILWDLLNYIFSRFTDDITYLFLFVAISYLLLPVLGIHSRFKENSIYFFLLFLITPNFFLYGANGIRNGLAASVFILSFRYFKSYKQWIWIFISSLIHLSMAIPAMFYLLSNFIKNIKVLYMVWSVMLLFSIFGINFLALIPIEFERLEGYIMGNENSNMILNIPVNFLMYSATPIIVSGYFILSKKIKDEFYYRISATYIMCNCVYIAAFQSSFPERFAYISEFLMPIVLVYPFFNFKTIKYKEIYLSLCLLGIFVIKAIKIFLM